MELTVEPFAGKLDYYALIRGNGALDNLRRHLMIRIIGFKYRRLKSSSLQSIKRGKPTEVDYFNGYIAKKGAEHGVPTPINTRIVQMVKEIEAGTRKIDPANFLDSQLHA
jgi:2-dehydropantoate 2-reductase